MNAPLPHAGRGRPLAAVLRAVALSLPLAAAVACDADSTGVPDTAQLRVFNAVTNRSTALPGSTIDVMVDDVADPPGARSVAFGTASGYTAVPAGVRDFTARVSGDTRTGGPENLLRLRARLQTDGGFRYTMYMVGVVPPGGVTGPGAVLPVYVPDDIFPPSTAPGSAERRARLKLVNAAPFAAPNGTNGAFANLYVTPASEPAPAFVSDLAAKVSAPYRSASRAFEITPGAYTVTITAAGRIVGQSAITLAPGAARTLVLVSTGAAPGIPSVANHALVTLVDGDF